MTLIGLCVMGQANGWRCGLARALLEIIESPDERERRAHNAHQRVQESFTVQPQVVKIEAILQQVAKTRR